MSIAWEKSVENNETQTQQFSIDPIINQKVKLAVQGLQKYIQNYFLEFPTERDKELVADFLITCSQQENIAIKTKRVYLIALAYLSRYLKNEKSFDAITAKDISSYLNNMQKNETEDPNQSWIRTQRTMGIPLLKFFKWLAYPDLTPQERKHLPQEKHPPVLRGLILQTKKGSKSPVSAKDIWDDMDVAVFLRNCTDSPRLRLYHVLAYETSARPGELTQLKIGDIVDNIQTDENGKLCALIDVGRYGKTKKSRIVGITDFTIQYLQAYLTQYHPDSTNRKAFLFMSKEHSAKYRNIPISLEALRSDYIAFRDNKIPKLLKRPDVSEEDKKHLQFLKDTKKWYPYILRHSSLTKLKDDPNVNDYTLRQHAGWSKKSDMPEIYTHDLKGDSVEHVMLAYGIKLKNGKKKRNEHLQQEMVGPHCPFCKMVNIPNSQFCSSCHKPLSLISYNKVIEEAEQTKKELAELKAKQEEAIRKEEQREYDMEDMQEKLKAVQEQLNGGLLDMFLSHLKIYEPELAQYLKDKKDKNEKISIKEEEKKLPKPKTWQGEAIISSYGLENEELLRARNLLKYYPEQALKVLNDEKNKNENEEKKKC